MADYPIKTPHQLGAILQGFRREKKLTQQTVGANAGLAQKAISQIEGNPGPASFARIFRVVAALDLELVIRPRQAAGRKPEW